MNPFLYNLLNGLLLCLLGYWSKFLHFEYATYFILLGVMLVVLSYFVRSSHKILGSVAMFSTILSTIFLGYFFYSAVATAGDFETPVGMMFASGLSASTAFLQCAVNHCNKQPTDETGCCNSSPPKKVSSNVGACC